MLKPRKELKGKLNYKEGLSRMGGDEVFYQSLLISFINEKSEYKEKILNPLKIEDFDQAAKAAHTLKGTAGNLSLTSIHISAKNLEIILKENSSNKMEVDKALNNLFEELDNVLEKIEKLIS